MTTKFDVCSTEKKYMYNHILLLGGRNPHLSCCPNVLPQSTSINYFADDIQFRISFIEVYRLFENTNQGCDLVYNRYVYIITLCIDSVHLFLTFFPYFNCCLSFHLLQYPTKLHEFYQMILL